MLQISTEETYRDGDVIFHEGASGDWIYVVLEGAVELSKQVEDKAVVIDVVKPEDVFGELGFISKAQRSASAKAVGDTTLGIVDRSFLDQEYNKLSSDFRFILQTMANRLRKTTDLAMSAHMRRKDPRMKKVLTLSFKTEQGLADAFSEDIGAGGLFLKTASPLPKGELFTLKLTLPDVSTPLSIGCEVAWVRPSSEATASKKAGMGVQFVQISEADRQRLQQLIRKG
jgi:CRP/FNR family cyclic AMP-dependent transcriptional regulator